MDCLKAVLAHDVFPALGCTEPIAVAYAAGMAGKQLEGDITAVKIIVDPGVYKNGFAVTIPNTGGERGNLIAGVLGALIQRPDLKMEILTGVTKDHLKTAKAFMLQKRAHILCDKARKSLYIDVTVHAAENSARVVIEGSHTHIVKLEKNGQILQAEKPGESDQGGLAFRDLLKAKSFGELVDMAARIDAQDAEYIKSGIEMNLNISNAGRSLKKVSHYISELVAKRCKEEDLFSSCEAITTAAADARMAGLSLPVMASGGSGNQGVVAILVPYLVGTHYGVPEEVIIRSIGLSHLVNSYIKCFTGDLSPLCGCAIAAGVGAAVAIVYQRAGKDLPKITLAVNNLVSDLGGMLCDGAKAGCAFKVATSTHSAIRSAHMALNNHGITRREGFVGETTGETIRNLQKISTIGMSRADDIMLAIMIDKAGDF